MFVSLGFVLLSFPLRSALWSSSCLSPCPRMHVYVVVSRLVALPVFFACARAYIYVVPPRSCRVALSHVYMLSHAPPPSSMAVCFVSLLHSQSAIGVWLPLALPCCVIDMHVSMHIDFPPKPYTLMMMIIGGGGWGGGGWPPSYACPHMCVLCMYALATHVCAMYVCMPSHVCAMHANTCVCMHAHTCVCYVCMATHVCVCMPTHVCAMYACPHMCMYAWPHMHVLCIHGHTCVGYACPHMCVLCMYAWPHMCVLCMYICTHPPLSCAKKNNDARPTCTTLGMHMHVQGECARKQAQGICMC
jgi:hypothetical protein